MESSQAGVEYGTISMREAAKILGIARTTVAYRVSTGRITPAGKLAGKTGSYFFNRAYIEELAKHQEQKALAANEG